MFKLIYFFPPKDFSAASMALFLAAGPLDAFPSGPVPTGVTTPATPPAEYSSIKSSSSSMSVLLFFLTLESFSNKLSEIFLF
jgi:hypothetical protein